MWVNLGRIGVLVGVVLAGWSVPARAGSNCADSNVFSIVAAGPGDVLGSVTSQVTGDPIAGAAVSINGGEPVQTDDSGLFAFSGVPAGQATISVSKPGYYNVTQAIIIREDSFTSVDILLTPDAGFGVAEVRGQFCGPGKHTYYLNGVSLGETFTATIDWEDYTPGYVKWITPYATYQDNCSQGQTQVSRGFDMGSQFGNGGRLKVVAVSGDYPPVESAPYWVNFRVVAPPSAIPSHVLVVQPTGQTLSYNVPHGACEIPVVDEGVGAAAVPDDIPFFKHEDVSFRAMGMFQGSVGGDGTVSGTLCTPESAWPELEFGLLSFKPEVSGTWVWRYNPQTGVWDHVESAFEISIDASAETPPYYIWLIPPIYAFGEGGVTFGFGVTVSEWTGPLQAEWRYTGQVKPWIGGGVGAGIDDILDIEGYINGGLHFYFVCPAGYSPCWGCLDRFGLWVKAGARGHFLWCEIFDLSSTWAHDFCGGGRLHYGHQRFAVRPMSRDYLRSGYAVFVANVQSLRQVRDEVTIEQPVQLNVFPWSKPDLAAAPGGDLLLVWIYDDPERTPVNRTELVFSRYDAGLETWSDPVAVADDGTADFHPQIATLAGGDALVAWENVSEVLVEPGEPGDPCLITCESECQDPNSPECQQCLYECKADETKSKMEIVVARYDSQTGMWAAPIALTDNDHLDRTARLAAAADGTAMLTWVSNQANDPVGSTAAPNDVRYATYDGTDWSAPADIAVGVPSVVKYVMAYNGSNAILLFVGDTDDDGNTLGDRELFAVEYSNGAWGPVTQLTSDGVEDDNPQVAYDSTGTPLLVWWRDGEIVMATDLGLSDLHAIVESVEGVSPGKAYLQLAQSGSGQLGLVWASAGNAMIDMFSALYDPTLQVWTKRTALTADDSVERSMASTFDEAGDLVVAYTKVETEYQTEIIMVGDVEVEAEIPSPGQAHLYLLRHIIGGDLAIAEGDITLDPPNPPPGTDTTITALVRNLGDVPAVNVAVAFYDGDPAGEGELIDVAMIAGPLVGNAAAAASVEWLVPPSYEPRDIYVVVDPYLEQEDRDRTNNSASLTVLAPDLTVAEIAVQTAGPDRLLTVRVANEGVLSAADVEVVLRRGSADGPVVATLAVPEIMAGAYHDVSYRWESPAGAPGGLATIWAVVDEAQMIPEFDETNNVRSVLVPVGLAGDMNCDGVVDGFDIQPFVLALTDPDGYAAQYPDCNAMNADINGDGVVDGFDIQPFVGLLVGG